MIATLFVLAVVWLLGLWPAIAWALRQRMLQPVCQICGRTESESTHIWCDDRMKVMNGVYCFAPVQFVPRGARRARTGIDVAHAAGWAFLWPYLLLAYVSVWLTRATGTRIAGAVPLTAPELERRLNEQTAEIARLTKEIDEGKGS